MPTVADLIMIMNSSIIVKQTMELFGDAFVNEPARRYVAEHLAGLMVTERKNISAISVQKIKTQAHP